MLDSYFTPVTLAKRMVKAAIGPHSVIADFAAGDGRLLAAALGRWRSARIVACDIDNNVVSRLRRNKPEWTVSRCDFLNRNSRISCRSLREAAGKVSLAILNPPFSNRGAKRWAAQLGEEQMLCSQAMAFICEASNFLRPDGEIIALIPAGSLRSDCDRKTWESLRGLFKIDVVQSNGHKTFEGCFPKTAIVHLARRSRRYSPRPIQHSPSSRRIDVEIVRGSLPMYRVKSNAKVGIPLVHSTDLRSNPLQHSAYVSESATRTIAGPAILLPRVGLPDIRKVRTYLSRKRVALSDCVVGLKCTTSADVKDVLSLVTTHWKEFEREYGGTCARYITLESLGNFLRNRNVYSTVVE